MLINGTKFACATCIKGHRSSHCQHTDRPLFEIRKKGRPVSQCTYCRDLRKSQQAYVKSMESANSVLQKPSSPLSHDASDTDTDNSRSKSDRPSQCTCPQRASLVMLQQPEQKQHNQFNKPIFGTEQVFTFLPNNQVASPSPESCTLPTPISKSNTPSKEFHEVTHLPSPETPYSWAIVAPGSLNVDTVRQEENVNLGFVFHKPQQPSTSSLRFLEGLPRKSRKGSSLSRSNSTSSSKRSHARPLLPDFGKQSTEEGFKTPPERTSPTEPRTLEPRAMDTLPENGVLDNLMEFEPHPSYSTTTQTYSRPRSESSFYYEGGTAHHPTSAPISDSLIYPQPLPSVLDHIPQVPYTNSTLSHNCGSFAPAACCRQSPNQWSGESVVITITPLDGTRSHTDKPQSKEATATRIVTCFCGPTCTCPGCLVHPGNFFLGNHTLDPYTGLFPVYQTANSTSTTSSVYGSDEEEQRRS